MHVFHLQRHMMLTARDREVSSQPSLRHEIHAAGSGWHIMIGEEYATSKLKKGSETPRCREVVLEIKRGKAHSIGIFARLRNVIDGNGLHRVLHGSAPGVATQ